MAGTYQDWIDTLCSGLLTAACELATVSHGKLKLADPCLAAGTRDLDLSPFKAGFWPYSTFFDWQLLVKHGTRGLLPPIRKRQIATTTQRASAPAEDQGTFPVNTCYLLVGLNPSRPLGDLGAIPVRDHTSHTGIHDPNGGSFRNFTLASEWNGKQWKGYPSWSGIGSLVHELAKPQHHATFRHFRGSYMMDLWPLISSPSSQDAVFAYGSNPQLHNEILRHEISTFLQFTRAVAASLKIICFGQTAFNWLARILSCSGPSGLVPSLRGATVIHVRHYGRGHHQKCLADLGTIAADSSPNNLPPFVVS
jgi:hypothetical protein